jgi:hypothetical protein
MGVGGGVWGVGFSKWAGGGWETGPSPTAAVLKLLAKTPLPTTLQSCWERIFAFLFFFPFNFFVGPSYYNYISTSKLGDVLSYLAIFR